MRLALIAGLLATAAAPALAADRDPTVLSEFQIKALNTAGVRTPPRDALASAAILVDAKTGKEFPLFQPTVDSIVGEWTTAFPVSDVFGMPCDRAVAACLASARRNAAALVPILREHVRDFSILLLATVLAERYSIAELASVRAFVASDAGKKSSLEAFTGGNSPDDYARWRPVEQQIDALVDTYRRRFVDETRALPRAKPLPPMPAPTPPPAPIMDDKR